MDTLNSLQLLLASLLTDESYAERVVDEEFVVKCVILTVLVAILSWIYQCVNVYCVLRLRRSLESCIVPARGAKDYLCDKFDSLISRSLMGKVMTVIHTEKARKKLDERDREVVETLRPMIAVKKQETLGAHHETANKNREIINAPCADNSILQSVLARREENKSLYRNYVEERILHETKTGGLANSKQRDGILTDKKWKDNIIDKKSKDDNKKYQDADKKWNEIMNDKRWKEGVLNDKKCTDDILSDKKCREGMLNDKKWEGVLSKDHKWKDDTLSDKKYQEGILNDKIREEGVLNEKDTVLNDKTRKDDKDNNVLDDRKWNQDGTLSDKRLNGYILNDNRWQGDRPITRQFEVDQSSLKFQPALIIPVPTRKKIKFNNRLLQSMKK